MAKKSKYYVVWHGVTPGVYTSWTECQQQTKGFQGAIYKSFNTIEEANEAYKSSPQAYIEPIKSASSKVNTIHVIDEFILPDDVIEHSLCVDAACSGNPGKMEYRGVYTANKQEMFKFGPIWGTNNIGEFLAIVHGLAYIKQKKLDMPIYSDSVNAIKWVKNGKCKTTLPLNSQSAKVHELIRRAEFWLQNNSYTTEILKWETQKWGEIPADFGRK